jgi:branched-chain amino acid transport system permease protein
MAVAGVAGVGVIIDHFGIRPLRDRHAYVLILTLALALFFQELMFGIYGPYGKPVQAFMNGEWVLGRINISYQKILMLVVAAILVTGLWFFLKKTRTGKSISAVAQNKAAAILVGIQYEKAYRMTMAISAALAAVAGVFISPMLEAVPSMWAFPLFKAFGCVIIGGLGSLEGAIIASLILGYAETLVSVIFSANYSDMVSLVAIILVLLVKPTGLMSKGGAH